MPRDCLLLGHIRVDQDEWCLACETPLDGKSIVTVQVNRPHDELEQQGIATVQEWGPIG